MKLSLGANTQSTQGESSKLGVGIHDVKFVSLTNETLQKKDGSDTFDTLQIKFEGINASAGKTYTHTVWAPKAGDDVRKENNFGYSNPSVDEERGHLLMHLLNAVAPKVIEEIKKKGVTELSGWDKIKAFMIKSLAKSNGVETQIKLVADKEGRGVFPSFVLGMSKEIDPETGLNLTYPKTNFIGKGLTYTANEVKQIESRKSARPTNMQEVSKIATAENVSIDDELDLDLDLV